MRTNVRIGNDIRLMWQILDGGVPVNLMNATDIKVSIAQGGTPSCNKIEITTFEIIDAVNGMISVEVQKEVITKLGYLWTVLEYTVPDSGMIDGNRKVTVDNVPVRIVSLTAEASQVYEFNVSSDILAGFQGKSAFEVWLDENPDKTEEDYFNWLQKPATDIAETVGLQEQARVKAETSRQTAESLRVEAELLRQSSTQEAISNAENATENANTAAQNADDAREAIQSDLGAKANHGYASIEVSKTLKQVEDDTSVKMTNLLQNSSFENGDIAPVINIDEYGSASTLSINTINPISGNYDARLEVTAPGTRNNRPGLNLNGNQVEWVLNHIFYFGMSVNINSGTPIITSVYNGAGAIALGLTLKDGFNSWTVKCLGVNSYAFTYLDGHTLWDFNFDNLIAYDLTAIFGAGNEPTKEEMNLLISTLGIDYFEGEITIPAQKIMQWQLKLIRKNKNAIIALGGTII